jgi:hypothetical protein
MFFFHRYCRRYHDKERSNSPENVVTTAPSSVSSKTTYKSDDNKKSTINVKAPIKQSTATTRTAKKIDMGAALNYGKSTDLGINSPTHRNTHNEDLFSPKPAVSTAKISNNDIIEDIFSSASAASPPLPSTSDFADDFNPRAEETNVDFGDFESAFGATQTQTTPAVSAAPVEPSTEFADFSSAFLSQLSSSQGAPPDNFVFVAQKPAPVKALPNLLESADLFGNSVITKAFASPTTGSKDLLSDFGDLSLNSINGE